MKLDRVILNSDRYMVSVDVKGVYITKLFGAGDEKDCDVEFTWDEIFEMGVTTNNPNPNPQFEIGQGQAGAITK